MRLGQPGLIGELKEGASQVINKNFQRIFNALNKKECSNWGFVLGDNTSKIEKAITFPFTFDDIPIVLVTAAGYKNNSDPADLGDFISAMPVVLVSSIDSITTKGFNINFVEEGGYTLAAVSRFGFTWTAKEADR